MKSIIHFAFAVMLGYALAGTPNLQAEDGADAWLRYTPLSAEAALNYRSLPAATLLLGDTVVLTTAQTELVRGIKSMLGRTLRTESGIPTEDAIFIGTIAQLRNIAPSFHAKEKLRGDGFWLTSTQVRGFHCIVILGTTDRGALYGVFAFLSRIARHLSVSAIDEIQQPSTPVRWVNQWDNLDGTIERGYAGRSIFFDNGNVGTNLTRVSEYARLLASIGINGCNVNNVNADLRVLDTDFIPQLARIAQAFRPWGVQLGVSIDVSAPRTAGGLDTFDPLDSRVEEWWEKKFDELYRAIPDFGGVVVKADSEGRLGPSLYGRTPADAANVIARSLKRHGGFVFYRAFVYNHHLDWTNLKNDRAKAAYDIFHPLDGKFDDNVIVQIKYGPIDFQVREPVSPLFPALPQTNTGIELQITQEYTGQQRHTCFLVPMWKRILDFDMRVNDRYTPVKKIAGSSFDRPLAGYIGVANVGLDRNWLGNHLALANLYGFGRLAWNPDLSSKTIVEEWTRMTFGNDPIVVATIRNIQVASWKVYQSYTGVLGLQTLTNILGSHYGPAPESQEGNGWGQWIRADHQGVGMDRSVATGTGFVGQYSQGVQEVYESLARTPDELVLFFHHVPYTYKLHSGQTVIQNIYDAHYDGAERARQFVAQWKSLRGRVDDARYEDVLAQLTYQSGHAIVWRDAVDDWFYRISGIPDAKGRVGRHPDRTEAESMLLEGYNPVDVSPWETASGGKAIECAKTQRSCVAKLHFGGTSGWYDIDVEYFDQNNGVSRYKVFVNRQLVDEWLADLQLPAAEPNGDSSTRRHISGVALRPGDELRIEGFPDAGELAPLDYIEIQSALTEGIAGTTRKRAREE